MVDDEAPPPGVDAEGRLRLEVPADEAGSRLDRVLGRALAPQYSRSYLSALIDEGTITVDGRTVRPAFRVAAGATVQGELGVPAGSLPKPEPMELSILFEDEELIVLDKAAGRVVHPGSHARSGTLVQGLLAHDPGLATVGQADRPGIVHRLDRDTTGVMVVARTNLAARSLVNQFKAKTVEKEYAALVWGEMPFDSDWIDLALDRDPRRPLMRCVVDEGGKTASTFYKVQQRLGRATWVSVYPKTGRTHQIRVHLEHIGFPIIGDRGYGRAEQASYRRWAESLPRPPVLERQALHARRLTLCHPRTGMKVTFESPVPADMADLIEVLSAAQQQRRGRESA